MGRGAGSHAVGAPSGAARELTFLPGCRIRRSAMSFEFLTESTHLPFSIALVLLFLFAALELLGLLLGHGLSHVLDSWLHLDAAAHSLNSVEKLLGWLFVGRVPALVLVTVFLAAFGVGGIVAQEIARTFLGHPLSAWIVAPMVLVPSLFLVRTVGRLGARVLGRRESDAVSADSLVGRSAVIMLGTARRGSPAQAKVQDEHRRSHYVMVEPSSADTAFIQGHTVTLVERRGSVYTAV